MKLNLYEYKVENRTIYTSSAPCTLRGQRPEMNDLLVCFNEMSNGLYDKNIWLVCVLLTNSEIQYYYKGELLPLYGIFGMDVIHFPIPDFGIPKSIEDFDRLQTTLVDYPANKAVLIHCRGGIGRSGLCVGGFLIKLGINPMHAIQMVRNKRHGSVETEEQEEFLFEYARRIRKE